jgi:hypothetical protein
MITPDDIRAAKLRKDIARTTGLDYDSYQMIETINTALLEAVNVSIDIQPDVTAKIPKKQAEYLRYIAERFMSAKYRNRMLKFISNDGTVYGTVQARRLTKHELAQMLNNNEVLTVNGPLVVYDDWIDDGMSDDLEEAFKYVDYPDE